MATKISQKNNTIRRARNQINNATTFAELKAACLDLTDATLDLQEELKKERRRRRRREKLNP